MKSPFTPTSVYSERGRHCRCVPPHLWGSDSQSTATPLKLLCCLSGGDCSGNKVLALLCSPWSPCCLKGAETCSSCPTELLFLSYWVLQSSCTTIRSRDAAIWKDLLPRQQGGITTLPLSFASGIPTLKKNKQSLLWSMLLQSSQGSPACKLPLTGGTEPASGGVNSSAKTLKTEMMERGNWEYLSAQIKSEEETRAMWFTKESQERYSLEQLGFKDFNRGLDTLTSVHS